MLIKLKVMRKQNHISIYDMARYLNITSSYYSQIENERRRLFYDTAIRIAFYFGVKPSELFEMKEEERKQYEEFPFSLYR